MENPDTVGKDGNVIINGTNAVILTSLTAPVDLEDADNESLFKQRRKSIAEAATENMGLTKNGAIQCVSYCWY